jgi:hypothetical protein
MRPIAALALCAVVAGQSVSAGSSTALILLNSGGPGLSFEVQVMGSGSLTVTRGTVMAGGQYSQAKHSVSLTPTEVHALYLLAQEAVKESALAANCKTVYDGTSISVTVVVNGHKRRFECLNAPQWPPNSRKLLDAVNSKLSKEWIVW